MTTLIGLIGVAGSGKSTAARILCDRLGAVEVSLADPIKRIAGELFGFDRQQLYGPSECRNAVDQRYNITPRHVLQTLGSWGREMHEGIWVDAALRLAAQHPVAVIPDVRYHNEADAIHAAGGCLIRIVRPGAGLVGAAAQHPSELAQSTIRADAVVTNDGSIEDLRVRLALLMDALT